MHNKESLVGVVVPIFKVDFSLVEKCILSIIGQTYKNIEIILVDDGNTSEYAKELEKLEELDERVVLVHHCCNEGLYRARLTGVSKSVAEYITFVDADDSITIDWIRLLVKKAMEDDSDIVMGKTINIDEKGWKYIYNSNNSFCNRPAISKNQIMNLLMEDYGLDFSIHTVWNKLYSKRLWDRAWKDLAQVEKHIVMTEDILFSFILFYHATKMSFSDHDGYLYYRNQDSSTVSSGSSNRIKKNIEDISASFSEVEDFLKRKKIYDSYEICWNEWKERYFRWWSYSVDKACSQLEECEKNEIINTFLAIFKKQKLELPVEVDSYFGEKKVEWNETLENIKKEIVSTDSEVVSFDLFDTLIVRPVLEPGDVFEVVLNDLEIELSKRSTLKTIRKLAEQETRKNIVSIYPQYEDVTLTEIYDTLFKSFNLPEELCKKIKLREETIEIEFAQKRKIGYELFSLAKESGKRLFITSDMYLERSTINKILEKNGYCDCTVLLSSEERLLKSTGNLFNRLIEESKVEPNKIIHIGDNWENDYIKPQKYGIKTFFLPKTKDILLNYLGDVNTGNAAGKAVENIESIIDFSKHFSSFSVRCMYANVANNMFDNPYVSFYEESDYNGDPYYLGNFAVGMHMFGIAKWLSDLVDRNEYQTVHFVSRDGYFLQYIYDRIRKKIESKNRKSNYLFASRKSFIPLEFQSKEDVGKIFANSSYSANTGRSIIKRYSSILKPITSDIEANYKEKGFILDKPFENEEEWIKFILCLKELQYSEEKTKESFNECQEYLKNNVKRGDLIFDLGYSGKIHSQIIRALGFSVDGAYVNFSGYDAVHKNKEEGLNILSYYDFIPCMYGIVTEYIFSDRGPSCIGYVNGKPIFEEKMKDVIGDYVIQEINRGAYDFTNMFLSSWGERMSMMDILPIDSSLQFEKFLVAPTKFDQEIFNSCYVEDEFYGGIRNKKLIEIWNWQLFDRNVKHTNPVVKIQSEVKNELTLEEMEYKVYLNKISSRNLFVKALYWLCVNKAFFLTRLKDYFLRRG